MRNLHFYVLGLSISTVSIFNLHLEQNTKRRPASTVSQNFLLEIKTLNIDPNSALKEAVGSELRATFNRTDSVTLAQVNDAFLRRTQNGEVDIKMDVDSKWIENDQLEFKIELVKKGIIDRVIVRCAQVSKKLSDYNRSYQCFLPGEETAFISYRLSNDSKIKPSIARK